METSNVYQKHLNLSKRIIIEKMLDQGSNFKSIADTLGKSNRTISYEVLKHREKKPIEVFNVRDFVKEKKQAGLFNMFDQKGNDRGMGLPQMPMFPGFDMPDGPIPNGAPGGGIDVDALVKALNEAANS